MANTGRRFGSRPADVQGLRLDEHPEEVIRDDEPGDSRENPIILDSDDDGSHDDRAHNSTVLTSRKCRICKEKGTGSDPLISLGCKCKGDLSIGHKSCLLEWFKPRLARILEVDCEVCKGSLGRSLLSPLLANHLPINERRSVMPSEIILVKVPVKDLNRLQVPIDTPAFDTLDRQTKEEIEQILRTEQLRYKDRRVTPDDVIDDRVRMEQKRQARKLEMTKCIDLVMVKRTPEGTHPRLEQCAFFPRKGYVPNIKIVLHNGIGDILRVPASGRKLQKYVLEKISQKIARHPDLIADSRVREAYILLPHPMIVDAIRTKRRDGPAAPGPSDPASDRRQLTYGRYVMIPFPCPLPR